MPRKDGSPTSAERKDAERRESNRHYILDGKDLTDLAEDTLTVVRDEWSEDALVCALIDAELNRRAE